MGFHSVWAVDPWKEEQRGCRRGAAKRPGLPRLQHFSGVCLVAVPRWFMNQSEVPVLCSNRPWLEIVAERRFLGMEFPHVGSQLHKSILVVLFEDTRNAGTALIWNIFTNVELAAGMVFGVLDN